MAYWHTSHGSQLVTGADGMDEFFGGRGWYTIGGDGGLRLAEQGTDIGNPGISGFEASVRAYLGDYPETNVVMASWCGQVSSADEAEIERYDPDGRYFGDKRVDDACGYDGGNWAEEWLAANPDGFWDCPSAHSAPVNANLKAMAAWRLWIALAAGT